MRRVEAAWWQCGCLVTASHAPAPAIGRPMADGDSLYAAMGARCGMGTHGSPKIWIRLVRQGWRVSVNTIAKIMSGFGLVARKVRRRRGLTRPGKWPAAPDFVRRDFTAEAPDLVWCGDMTEIDTGEGKLYLATVIDLFSRRLLGYAMGTRHDAELVVAALHMAATTRGGDVRGVIFHTDRGSEYAWRKLRRAWFLLRQRRQRGVQQRPEGRVRPPAHLCHPCSGPDTDRDLDHRLLQRSTDTQRVWLQEPDRIRARLLGRPQQEVGCIGRSPRFEGIGRWPACPWELYVRRLLARLAHSDGPIEQAIPASAKIGRTDWPLHHHPAIQIYRGCRE